MTRMAALGIRNLSRRALFSFEDEFSVFGYGSRCEDRVYCLGEEYDHLSAIRSVSVKPFTRRCSNTGRRGWTDIIQFRLLW